MALPRLGSIALISAFAVLASVQPARAAQTGPMYWVCSHDTRTQPTSELYVSDVMGPYGQRMQNNYTATILEQQFTQFLNSTYKPPKAGHCSGYESVAKAQEAIKKMLQYAPNAKLVETHWKSTAPTESAAASASTAPPADAPLLGFCWVTAPDYTVYISRPAVYDRVNMQGVDIEFAAYIAKAYELRPGGACLGARTQALIDRQRQITMDDLRRTPKVKFLEFDWAPPAKPAAAKPTPATPPPPPVAAAPAKPAPAQTVDTFSYCYAYGTPQGPGTGKPRKQHYYVTALFARAAADRPDGDWQKFIRAAHTDEAFNASCTPPGPRATTEQKRLSQIGDMRKLANFEVVDVDWKR